MRGFTTKRARQKRNSYFSFANERREETRLCGFTLIETLVAITILTLAVTGASSVANSALVAAKIARDQLIASHLAQEGIEYVRVMRNNEYLQAYRTGGSGVSENAWADFLGGSDSASIAQCRASACTLDPTRPMGTGSSFALMPCSGGVCAQPYLYLANGVYTHETAGGTQTPFRRTIQALDVSANDEKIVSTVTWDYHGTGHSVTIVDHLTPWQ